MIREKKDIPIHYIHYISFDQLAAHFDCIISALFTSSTRVLDFCSGRKVKDVPEVCPSDLLSFPLL